MDKELQEKLFAKYPKIFRQKNLSIKESCMPFGIDCGNGWYGILDILCLMIQTYCDNTKIQAEASQVKEKFGTLRFYVDNSDDIIDTMIETVTSISHITCEECGSTNAKLCGNGWLITLCDNCNNKRGK